MDFFTDFFKKIQIPYYTDEITATFTTKAVVFGIIIAALCVFAAFAAKEAKVTGIIAGIANFASALLIPHYIGVFHSIEMYKEFYGYSQSDIQQQMSEYYMSLIPDLITLSLASTLMIVAIVFTAILAARLMKVIPKVFGVFAIIVTIVRYLFISPVPIITPMLSGGATIDGQTSHLTLYFVSVLIPVLLLAIGALIKLLKPAKAEPAVEGEAATAETVTDTANE